jgi:hypothetical protein
MFHVYVVKFDVTGTWEVLQNFVQTKQCDSDWPGASIPEPSLV